MYVSRGYIHVDIIRISEKVVNENFKHPEKPTSPLLPPPPPPGNVNERRVGNCFLFVGDLTILYISQYSGKQSRDNPS